MSGGQFACPEEREQIRTKWAHDCDLCGGGAPFGFVDRRGDQVWFCAAHREAGRRLVRQPVQSDKR